MTSGMKMLMAVKGSEMGKHENHNGGYNMGYNTGGYNGGGSNYQGLNETRPRIGYEMGNAEIRNGYSEMDDMEDRFRDRRGREHYDNGRYAPMKNEYMGGGGMETPRQIGFADSDVMPFSQITAERWIRGMENEDGTKGPHWTIEQVKQVMGQRGINLDPWEFFAALNAMYSDYCKVFKKYGVGDKLDFYVDMAKAFIDDKDAVPDKLAKYFQYVVKH